ncbi:hypothetical protein ACP8VW_08710, partial [Klebsiella pneumoniae]
KNSLNRLIRCVCGKKIGPDPRNFNQRVSLGRNDLLIRTFLSADVDSSQQAYKVDDGREALALYNEEVKVLDREYGPATIKEEFIAEKGKFYQSLSACIAKQQEWYNKRLDLNKIKKCSTWQRTYKKGRVTVLLYIEPRQVSKHYIYK